MSNPLQTRANRWRNVILGGTSAGLARGFAMGCNLVQVPLALRLLGPEMFGLWITLQATAAFVALLDLGLGYRLQNHLAQSAAHGRPGEARTSVRKVTVIATVVAATVAGSVLLMGEPFWRLLLGVAGEPAAPGAGPSLAALAALSCGLLPANLGLRLASGLQRQWAVGASQAAGSLGLLVWTGACTAGAVSPGWFIAGSLLLPILINGSLLVLLWLRLPPGDPATAEVTTWRWVRESLPFFGPQLSACLRSAGPAFIIAAMLGPAAVTPYNLIQRVLNFITQPQNWLLDPLWSGITDAASRDDWSWIRSALRLSFGLSVIFTVLPTLSLLGWGAGFIEWWTGFAAADLPAGLLGWLVASQVATTLTQPFTTCLNGLGRMHGQLFYGTISTVLGLAALAMFCRPWGLAAALAPTALLLLGFNLPCAIWDVRLALRRCAPAPKSS